METENSTNVPNGKDLEANADSSAPERKETMPATDKAKSPRSYTATPTAQNQESYFQSKNSSSDNFKNQGYNSTKTSTSTQRAGMITDNEKKSEESHAQNTLNGRTNISKEKSLNNMKRDRTAAFTNNSVLEGIPNRSENQATPNAQPQEADVAEPPQKLQRIDRNEEKKDEGSSEDSSYDGDLVKAKKATSKGSPVKMATGRPLETKNSTDYDFNMPECDDYFLSLVNLDPIPEAKPLPRLLPRQLAELEKMLQIGTKYSVHSADFAWKDDWNGNLQMIDKEIIMNWDALEKSPSTRKITITFCEWVSKFAKHADDFTGVKNLFSYIYNLIETPPMAKRIMAYYIQRQASSVAERLKFIEEATSRILYDPIVLKQDGWTTAKADAPDGATGGAFLIGRKIMWERSEAIIIAFVRDDGLGDLWKCMWIEDFDTFDLEADELQVGIKKWERKMAKQKLNGKQPKTQKVSSTSTRFEQHRHFTVKGIEDGIILATSYKGKGSRPWPARIMHVTEVKAIGQLSSRRSSSKNEIHVVFLAPYWNGQSHKTTNANSSFSTGPLFELETIDVSADTIQEYPYDISSGTISIEKLRAAFTFLGLPKSAFPRYVDSHRIALALKLYANGKNTENSIGFDSQSTQIAACASLTDTHPLSVRTFSFPDALLNLPFQFTLSKYALHDEKAVQAFDSDEETEPIMKLGTMMDALCPPRCWGHGLNNDESNTAIDQQIALPIESPSKTPQKRSLSTSTEIYTIENFCSKFFIDCVHDFDEKLSLKTIKVKLEYLVSSLNAIIAEVESASIPEFRQSRLRSFLLNTMIEKGQGENIFFGPNWSAHVNQKRCLNEWRKCCERIFRRALLRMGHINTGNGVTAVLTDSRCNQHVTAKGTFERAVRLPAAIWAVKNAGAGSKKNMPLITKIEESYMKLAEETVIPMAHKASYLRRLKNRIASIPQDAWGEPLSEDSDGDGGEDTVGSRGSYTAALTGVAAALKGVDLVLGGKCVNTFCAIRPPGHHAGRELRPMNATSNGFCLLNPAACAALYATSPSSVGGLGLKRVCVVDIDVHHGNGTQDILASTYDPRFLFISTHAGGPHINGYSDDRSDDGLRRSLNNKDGIFPGRCGDTSPHKGVLNLPLGQRVTPSALGTALVCQVSPAIEEFSPELIIISAGFDAHKNDPLGLGGLSAEDFGTVTKVLCQLALKVCSGRVLSILEGGYGVPCTRPTPDLSRATSLSYDPQSSREQILPSMKLLKLGDDLPSNMKDPLDYLLAQKLDRCHEEGFIDCVREHVLNLAESSDVESKNS